MTWRDRLRAALNGPAPATRTTGRPTSSNGASSLHANWAALPNDVRAVSVDLTVLVPPTTTDLYFWAMQASFVSGSRSYGAGHLGLQHISGYPGNAAANWGGYRDGGGELAGTESSLPSARGNVNTRDYAWDAGRTYRLVIAQAGDESWSGSVIDVDAGTTTTIRELSCPGTELRHVVMWSEVFAACDAPAVTVQWANPTAHIGSVDGPAWTPDAMRLSYQRVNDGGCSNTVTFRDPDGSVVQRTNTERTNSHGDMI